MALGLDRIEALAPDQSSLDAAKKLLKPGGWPTLAEDQAGLVWGECQGSGATPYRVVVAEADAGYKCSCPSRKFPCKHALGLMLVFAAEEAKFQNGTPPDWVTEWLSQREEKAEKAIAKAEGKTAPADPVAAQAEAEKRARKREERVTEGLEEMEQWIKDIVRVGLSHCQNEAPAFWNNKAARLLDAQAPGVARRVDALSSIVRSGPGWHERLLEEISLCSLFHTAWQRVDQLPAPRQADLRRHLGWTTKQEEVLAQPGLLVDDTWQVLGQTVEKEDRLTAQRTWVRGKTSGQFGLLLSFAVQGQALDARAQIGHEFSGQLAFYESAVPLRAVIKEHRGENKPLSEPSAGISIDTALLLYAQALANDLWLESFPLVLTQVTTARTDTGWLIREPGSAALPVAPRFANGWKLHALGGGHPLTLMGEWTGRAFLPMSAFAEGRLVNLS